MLYNIMGGRFNSFIEINTEENTLYYMMPYSVINKEDIDDIFKRHDGSDLIGDILKGYTKFAQFRQYIYFDQGNAISHVDNIGYDNYSEMAEKIKLLVYDDDKDNRYFILVKNNVPFETFGKYIVDYLPNLNSLGAVVSAVGHFDSEVKVINDFFTFDEETSELGYFKNTD